VAVYDAAGRTVRELGQRVLSGQGVLRWDGKTASGSPAAPGVYFLRVATDDLTQVRRVAVIR
jgi:flagellar hook assembly protein FlgD